MQILMSIAAFFIFFGVLAAALVGLRKDPGTATCASRDIDNGCGACQCRNNPAD